MTEYTPHEAPVKDITTLPVMHPGRPVGRDEALKELYTHLKQNQPVLVHGVSGSGKTTLASALASAYAQQAGGVLWLNVSDSPLAELLVRVGRAYDELDITNSDNPLSMVGAVANTLTQHKPFVVLDGSMDEKVVTQFISKCTDKLPLLLLSEQEMEGPWATISLDKLSDTDAVILLKQKAGISDHDSDIDLYGIVKLLDYMPFPIVIVARAMVASKQSPADYFKTLQAIAQKADNNGLITALTASYRALNNALQGLMLMLGATFEGEGSAELLSMVSGVPEDSINQAMNILSQLYLVEKFTRADAPYYRLHPEVYTFTQTWLRGSNRLESLQAKVQETVITYAQKYSKDDPESHLRLATEMNSIIATSRHASENGDRDTANQFVVALTQAGDFVQARGYVYELLLLRALSSGSTSAFPAYGGEIEEDIMDLPDILDETDYELVEAGEFTFDDEEDDAVEDEEPTEEELVNIPTDTASLKTVDIEQLRKALNAARQQKDMPRQMQVLNAVGKVQIIQEREAEAIATYNELLSAYEATGDGEGTLETLDMLSGLLTRTDNSQAAILNATRGIQLADELDDTETKMHLLTTLGDARQNLGESMEGVQAYSQALDIARIRNDKQNEAIILYKLGYAHLDNGETNTSISTWEDARTLFKEQEKRDYEGRVLGGLGAAYSELERWSEAVSYHTSALHIAREVADQEEEALQLSNLAQALVASNKLPDALTRYRQALHLAYQGGNRDNVVSAIVDLVTLMMRSKRLLDICKLLVDDALQLEPSDRELGTLQTRIETEKAAVDEKGIQQAPVSGNARDYAANAYKLMEM